MSSKYYEMPIEELKALNAEAVERMKTDSSYREIEAMTDLALCERGHCPLNCEENGMSMEDRILEARAIASLKAGTGEYLDLGFSAVPLLSSNVCTELTAEAEQLGMYPDTDQ